LGIYRDALASASHTAVAPEGTIMVYEQIRGGKESHSWLNVGEERKLFKEEQVSIRSRVLAANRVKEVQKRFF
jgi:hypothetical protein